MRFVKQRERLLKVLPKRRFTPWTVAELARELSISREVTCKALKLLRETGEVKYHAISKPGSSITRHVYEAKRNS